MLLLRRGQEADAALLGKMNGQLILAEGSDAVLTDQQLTNRMKAMLGGGWQAVVVEDEVGPIGYCLFSHQTVAMGGYPEIYIRHFFLMPEWRGCGIGLQFFRRLQSEYFPANANLAVDSLATNGSANRFWPKVGFEPFSIQYRQNYAKRNEGIG